MSLFSGNRCVDTRREYCYTDFIGGRCSNPLQIEVLRAVCCCSSLGKAWGDHRCEPCPKKGKFIEVTYWVSLVQVAKSFRIF